MYKILFILTIFTSFQSHSDEADELVEEILQLIGVFEIVEQSIQNHSNELLRVYEHISEEEFNEEFAVATSSYREALISSYRKAYRGLSTAELKRMLNFYQSDEGKWFLSISPGLNDKILSLFAESGTQFNDAFVKKYNELYGVK